MSEQRENSFGSPHQDLEACVQDLHEAVQELYEAAPEETFVYGEVSNSDAPGNTIEQQLREMVDRMIKGPKGTEDDSSTPPQYVSRGKVDFVDIDDCEPAKLPPAYGKVIPRVQRVPPAYRNGDGLTTFRSLRISYQDVDEFTMIIIFLLSGLSCALSLITGVWPVVAIVIGSWKMASTCQTEPLAPWLFTYGFISLAAILAWHTRKMMLFTSLSTTRLHRRVSYAGDHPKAYRCIQRLCWFLLLAWAIGLILGHIWVYEARAHQCDALLVDMAFWSLVIVYIYLFCTALVLISIELICRPFITYSGGVNQWRFQAGGQQILSFNPLVQTLILLLICHRGIPVVYRQSSARSAGSDASNSSDQSPTPMPRLSNPQVAYGLRHSIS
eukprot:Clim_evm169s157 gene=Clim_evmTU169s157